MLIQGRMTDFEPPQAASLRRSRSICVTKCSKRTHLRRTSLCADYAYKGSSNGPEFEKGQQQQSCSLKVVEEDKVLSTFEQEEPVSLNAEDVDYEQPLRVFRRAGTPDKTLSTAYEVPPLKNHVSSCQALRQAVSTLYNFDDFEMTKIGEGFFSEVFKVEHKCEQGKIMVLKRNKHRANRNGMLKEVQLMNNLHHRNILKYEGACVHEGQLHALTEYVNGGSLDQLILGGSKENGDFPWIDRVSLAKDINEGIHYLHSRGIFHRDLTSKNVLIRRTDKAITAVVADFGLAAQIPKSPEEKLPQVGSPYWMSPECLQGKYYDHRSDTFSLGIILCEMIARVEADPDFLPRTQNFGVDYLAFSVLVQPECPEEFLKVAFSCVTIDPGVRPTSEDLQVSFKDILTHLKPKPVEKPVISDVTSKMQRLKLPLNSHSRNSKTPNAIGQEMSKLDPHYIPSPAKGMNPFLSLFHDDKIMGNQFFSCFEFNAQQQPFRPTYRKTVSMIGQHPTDLET